MDPNSVWLKFLPSLVAIPIGAAFGFVGGFVSDGLRRAMGRVDAVEELGDDFCDDLRDAFGAICREQHLTDAEVRSLIKKRGQLARRLTKGFGPGHSAWKTIEPALTRAADALRHVEDAADLTRPNPADEEAKPDFKAAGALIRMIDIEGVCSHLESTIRQAGNSYWYRRYSGAK